MDFKGWSTPARLDGTQGARRDRGDDQPSTNESVGVSLRTVVDGGGGTDTKMVKVARVGLDWADRLYGRLFLIGIALTVAGSLGIPLSVLHSAVTGLVLSVIATAVGLALLNPGLRRWSKTKRPLVLGIGLVSFALGAGLLVVAFGAHEVLLAIAGVFFVVTGILTLRATWRVSDLTAPVVYAPVGILLAALGLLVVQRGGLWDVFGGVLAVGGVVIYTSALRRYVAEDRRATRWLPWAGASTVAVGVACVVWASWSASPKLAVVGASLMVLGVIAMSLSSRPLRPARRYRSRRASRPSSPASSCCIYAWTRRSP